MLVELEDYIKAAKSGPITFDGLQDAIVGWAKHNEQHLMAVYSMVRMIQVLTSRDGMSIQGAVEFIYHNCVDLYLGTLSPIIVDDLDNICEY